MTKIGWKAHLARRQKVTTVVRPAKMLMMRASIQELAAGKMLYTFLI